MYSQAIFLSCSSVSLSSGEGSSETWNTVLVVLLLASRYGIKLSMQASISRLRIYRMVRASSARGALRLHPYPLSPCCNTTLRRARNPILYSQPLLSLFCEVENLHTQGFQFPRALFQCGDLMRDCDVGKVRIDDLYDLIMQAKYPAPCHISMIGFPILASEPDVHLPAYPALY